MIENFSSWCVAVVFINSMAKSTSPFKVNLTALLNKFKVRPQENEDKNGAPVTPLPYTLKTAFHAMKSRAGKAFPIVVAAGVPPVRTEVGVTHWILPLNNVGGSTDKLLIEMAKAEGVDYANIKLSTIECLHFLKTGELPED